MIARVALISALRNRFFLSSLFRDSVLFFIVVGLLRAPGEPMSLHASRAHYVAPRSRPRRSRLLILSFCHCIFLRLRPSCEVLHDYLSVVTRVDLVVIYYALIVVLPPYMPCCLLPPCGVPISMLDIGRGVTVSDKLVPTAYNIPPVLHHLMYHTTCTLFLVLYYIFVGTCLTPRAR